MGRDSTSHIISWYRALSKDAKALEHVAGFEPIMRLLPKDATIGIIVQVLAERWGDTTHTCHIVKREMMVTPYDFHRMIDPRSDGPIVDTAFYTPYDSNAHSPMMLEL